MDNDGYDVNLLLQGAIDNDLEAKEYLEYLVHRANTSNSPIPFQIVRESYTLSANVTVVHSSFLTNNDINFITNSLHEKVNVLFATVKDNKVLFVNPYNANYFIFDSFSVLPIEDIIQALLQDPSQPYKHLEKYTEQLIDTTITIKD